MSFQDRDGSRAERFSPVPDKLDSQQAIAWLRATHARLAGLASSSGDTTDDIKALRVFDWQQSALLTDVEKTMLDHGMSALKEMFGTDDLDLMIDGAGGALYDDIKEQFAEAFGIVPVRSGDVILFRRGTDDAFPQIFELNGAHGNLYERIALKLCQVGNKAGKDTEDLLCSEFSANLKALVACLEDATRFAAFEAGRSEKLPSGADEPFVAGYISCALWSGGDDGEFDGCDVSDIAEPSLRDMIETCVDFQSSNAENLVRAYLAGRKFEYNANSAGHDLWLTRNRHGAGFWDRGLGAAGDALTDMATPYGSADLYRGDDGLVWQAGTEPARDLVQSNAGMNLAG